MRRTTTIEIAGQPLTVSEIPVSRILRLLRGEESILALPTVEAGERVKELIPLAFEGDFEQILAADLFYDDLQAIFKAFQETNPAFFETARALGLADALAEFVQTLLQNFCNRLLISLNTGTARLSGAGATDSSSI